MTSTSQSMMALKNPLLPNYGTCLEDGPANKSLLEGYIISRLDDHEILKDSERRKLTRKILEIAASIIVIGSRAAIVQTCLKGSSVILNQKITDMGSLLLGIPNAVGSVISYGGLSILTKLEIIEILTRHISKTEQQLMSDDLSPSLRTYTQVASLFLGFSSQIPLAVGAYEGAFITPPLVNGIFTFLDGGRSSWSMYKTITAMMRWRKEPKTVIGSELIQARQTLVNRVEDFRSLLASEDDSLQNLEKINLMSILNNEKKPIKAPSLSFAVTSLLNIFVVSMLSATFAEFYKLGAEGGMKIWDNKKFGIFIGSFVVSVNVYLWFDLVSRTTFATADLLRGAKSSSLTKKIAPQFYQRFTVLGTLISVPTFVPPIYFAKLYFSPPYYELIATFAATIAILGGVAAMHKLRDIIILRRNASNSAVVLDHKLSQISETISKTNLFHIANFLVTLPEDIRNKLSLPNLEKLQEYIGENPLEKEIK